MVFAVGDMEIATVGTDGDDRAIEFLVRPEGVLEEARFAISREHGQGWETARLTLDPHTDGVPLAAVEWAVEFAREYL
ncbi:MULTISPECIES: hypothetical protein [Streptomyces]|uniref:Uncharacterized protein n=1 Tax=Streptomyces spororaveus TaxID=284039 RepID=A0ABQ3TCI2_9ACTN|nr:MULTISPECIES: hypothetical protein [Streptomyces]MCM9081492.1 hypothetical protein [Streptomyces spororaveus]MCX5304058.1 hypothetical protein [Streptomyces sp. NBC_00160]GHI78076.1 hypothetical protein Sspor_36370 [Streptomyces spororaveus]